MQKYNIFSLTNYITWLCFSYLLIIDIGCSATCMDAISIYDTNEIDFQVFDETTKAELFLGVRPGGIYPSGKVKVLQENGEPASKYLMEIDDIASFAYANSSDTDAFDKSKRKNFYLHLETSSGKIDIDTITVDFKFRNSQSCNVPISEKVTVSYNGKIYFDKYNDRTIIQFFKKL